MIVFQIKNPISRWLHRLTFYKFYRYPRVVFTNQIRAEDLTKIEVKDSDGTWVTLDKHSISIRGGK